jgi:protein O-mannosyl-transferase
MLNKINISSPKHILIVYIALTLVTLAVYWQVNQFEFVNYDDDVYVTQNIHIRYGITLDGVRFMFGKGHADLWNPLVWLSFIFDYKLFGLNAGGYHLINLMLHILSALLLLGLFNRMTNEIWKSAFVAAVFALHPLHVESVAWISERKDVLSAFFWMLTLCLYVYYTEKPAVKRYLLVLFSFMLALMSKPMVVTLPVIMILLDYWPLKRFESKQDNYILWQLKEKTPFFILSGILVIVTLCNPNNSSPILFPLGSRIENSIVSFAAYLEKTFWPHDMAIFYPFPNQIPVWQVISASLLILIFTTVVIIMAKRLPYLFVGWMWYTITILPVIGIIQISSRSPYAMADRYHYLPSIGVAVGLAWGTQWLINRESMRKKILFPASIAVLTILAVLTWQQCGYWKNSIELWNHALRVTKANTLAYNNLGAALYVEGRIEEAIDNYNKAICIASDNTVVYNNHAVAYTIIQKHILYGNKGKAYIKQGNKALGCYDLQKACALGNCEGFQWAKLNGYCR